jgi:hypothetical protein
MADDITKQMTSNVILKSIRGVTAASETLQRGLMAGALTTSGILPAYQAVKGVANFVNDKNYNYTRNTFHKYSVPETDTLDTFRLPEMIHDQQDQMVVLNSAAQYVDEAGIDPAVFKTQIQKEYTKQLSQIDTIIEKNADNPNTLNQSLCAFLGHESPDILTDYRANMIANSQRLNGAFNRQITELDSLINRQNSLAYNAQVKAAASTIKAATTQIDQNVVIVQNALNPNELNSLRSAVSGVLTNAKADQNIANQMHRSGNIHAELNKTISRVVEEFKQNILQTTNTTLTEHALQKVDAQLEIWQKLGINDPEHNTLTAAFQTYKQALLAVINPNNNPKTSKQAMTAFIQAGDTVKQALQKYQQCINATSYTDPYGTNLTTPKVSDLQLQALKLVEKSSYVSDYNIVKPVNITSFKKLQETSLDFFTGVKDPTIITHDEKLDRFYSAFLTTFPKFKMEPTVFRQNVAGFLHLSEAAVAAPEQFIGTTGAQVLYRRAWTQYQRTLYEMREAVAQSDSEKQAKFQKFNAQIEKMLNWTVALNPNTIEQTKLSAAAAYRLQKLQLDKSYIAELLLSSPQTRATRELLNNIILDNTDLARRINQFDIVGRAGLDNPNRHVDLYCKTIIDYAHSTKNYRLLVERINNSDVLPRIVKAAAKSILFSMKGIRAKDFENYFDWFVRSTDNDQSYFSKIESLINTSKMQGSLSLDYLAKRYGVEVKNAHTAATDVNTLEAIIEKALPDQFQTPGVTYVLVDIETTGLSPYQNSTLEIAYKVLGAKDTVSLTRAYSDLSEFDVPNQAVLNTFFPGETELRQRELFKARYATGMTEQEMFAKFNAGLTELGPNVKLVYHNGDRFDVPFQKWRASGDQQYFTTLAREDTLQLLRQKCNYFQLAQTEKTELRAIMQEYVTLQYNIDPDTKLIQIPDGNLRNAIKQLSKEYGFGDLKPVYYELSDFYLKIREQNQLIGSHLMDANQFNAGEDYEHLKELSLTINQALVDDIEKNTEAYMARTGMTKEQLLGWTRYTHQFKLLYGLDSASNVFAFSYRNITDLLKESNWFNIPRTAQYDLRDFERMTRIAQAMERDKVQIKNIVPVKLITPEIQRSYRDFVLMFKHQLHYGSQAMRDALRPYQHLKLDLTNPLDQFIMLKEIWQSPAFNRLDLPKIINAKVVQLANDVSGVLTHPVVKDTEFTYMQTLENIDDAAMFDNIEKLDAVIEDFQQNTIDPLARLSESLDVHKIVSANALIQAQNMKPFAELLKDYADSLRKLTTYEAKTDFVREMQNTTNTIAYHQIQQLAELTPGTLRDLMLYEAPFITFLADEKITDPAILKSIQKFLHNQKEYTDAGIQVIMDKDPVTEHRRLYLALDLNTIRPDYFYDTQTHAWVCTVDGVTVGRPYFTKDTDLFQKYSSHELSKEISSVQDKLIYLSGQRSAGTLGDLMDTDAMLQIYKTVPESVQNSLMNFETFLQNEYWQTTHYNFVNIGSLASRKTFQAGYPNTLVSILKTSATKTSVTANTVLSRLEAYFNPAFSINNGLLAESDYTKNLVNALRAHPEYTLSALVSDKKTGYRVIQLDVSKPDVLNLAKRLDAVIMPYHIYSKLSTVLNQNDFSNKFLKVWNQLLCVYKTGCLIDPGVFFRNEIDSTLKVMTATQTGIETIIKKAQAQKLLGKFDNAYREILNMSQYDIEALIKKGLDPSILNLRLDAKNAENKAAIYDLLNRYSLATTDILKSDPNKAFLQNNLEFYFKYMNPDITRDEYELVSTFINNASAGMTKAMEEHYLDKNINNASGNIVWNSFLKYSNKLMHPNAVIDQVNRFAQYLIDLENGKTTTEAFYDVAKTHFDYANKTHSQRIIELIFPFYTFKMNNLELWVDAITSKPWLWTMFADVMRPVWNFDNTTPQELHYNKSLQYQILSGNIPLGNGLILKTAPSVMDAFNMVTDPLNAAYSSLMTPLDSATASVIKTLPDASGTAFLKNALSIYNKNPGTYGAEGGLDQTDLLNIAAMLPLVGPAVQRYAISGPKNYERSGNILTAILPGIFGAEKDYQAREFNNRRVHLKPPTTGKSHFYSHGYYPYSKHPKANRKMRKAYKSFAKRTYAKKSYAYRVYADKVYPTRVFTPKAYAHNVATPFTYYPGYYTNFYTKMYTKKGQSRMAQRMKLTQPQNLEAKLKDQFYNYRP